MSGRIKGAKVVTFKLSNYYQPLPLQKRLHESPAKFKCYMGGFGSGKTMWLCWNALLLSLEYPGNYGLLGRFTYPELRDTTMHDFFEICPEILIKEYKKTEHKLTLVNDSVILFRHLEDPDKIKSLNLGWYGIDELTEVPHDVWLMLQSRLRLAHVARREGFGSTNPEGHDWVYNLFKVKHKDSDNYLMINAPTRENVHLPSDYEADLREAYDDIWIKRYLEGDPSAFEGQILGEWNPKFNVLAPFEPPADWTRICVLDHGTNNPTAVLWIAIHPENFWVVYREHYHTGQVVEWHAKQIFELNGSDNITYWVADPAIFNKTQQDPKRGLYSVADIYADHGIFWGQGDNDVKAGIALMKDYVRVWKNLINPFTNVAGSPKLFITRNCENTLREIPQWRWKKLRIKGQYRNHPEEPEKANDHTVDCLRYALMTRATYVRKKSKTMKPFGSHADRMWDALNYKTKVHKRQHPSPIGDDLGETAKMIAAMKAAGR